MSSAQAILIGAIVIAASLVIVNGIRPADAQHYGGPYQLMHHSNTSGAAGVFRLDTSSGEVSFCYISQPNASSDPALVCTHGTR